VLLHDRNAVVYGGGGTIGGAVARAFGRERAMVHLAGRTLAPLERVADEIREAGGAASVAEVDALDERAVDAHADALVSEHGTLTLPHLGGNRLDPPSGRDSSRPVVQIPPSWWWWPPWQVIPASW
jgi:NAD(P)-dependent dehydrogenase (short-subunit alcohol dehydrogenase family)